MKDEKEEKKLRWRKDAMARAKQRQERRGARMAKR
jgi:hypothetical protein